MSARIPTLKILDANPRGWKIINATDFDSARHEIWSGDDVAPQTVNETVLDRDATIARAKGLGLKFGPRTSTESIARQIAEEEEALLAAFLKEGLDETDFKAVEATDTDSEDA